MDSYSIAKRKNLTQHWGSITPETECHTPKEASNMKNDSLVKVENDENMIGCIMSVKDISLKGEEQEAIGFTNSSEEGESEKEPYSLKRDMLHHISKSNAHFKSQQRGEPDLTFEEKHKIADDILNKSPALFLSRFGRFFKAHHLDYFHEYRSDYEVDFYLKEAEKLHCKHASQVQVKNRRYEALKAMIMKGDYFSEEEMKKRDPLLYEQLIGQYMTDEEKEEADKIDQSNCSLTNILLDHIDRTQTKSLQKWQEDYEHSMMEESDSDEDEENQEGEKKFPSVEEKDMLREEFVSSMYRSFLEGRDSEFDYSEVDFSADYDNLDIWQQDEEEKYFDSEEPDIDDRSLVPEQQQTNQMDVCD